MGVPEVVGELAKRYGSISRASRKIDMPVTTLWRMRNGQRVNPTIKTMRKIAAGLDWSLEETTAAMLSPSRDPANPAPPPDTAAVAAMAVHQLVEGLRRKYGSINAAARECGMPEGTLHRLHREDRDPRLSTLRLIAHGYGKSLVEIVKMLEGD